MASPPPLPDTLTQQNAIRQDFEAKATQYAEKYQTYTYNTRSYHLRNQLTLSWLEKKGGYILEAGCGPAILIKSLHELGYCAIGVDLVEQNLKAGKQQLQTIQIPPHLVAGNLTQLPFADRSFDEIVSLGVLEYILPIQVALGELHRLLRPGGQLIVSLPNRQSLYRQWEKYIYVPISQTVKRLQHPPKTGYTRLEFATHELPSLFENTGFQIKKYQTFAAQVVLQPVSSLFTGFSLRLAEYLEPSMNTHQWGKWLGSEILVAARRK